MVIKFEIKLTVKGYTLCSFCCFGSKMLSTLSAGLLRANNHSLHIQHYSEIFSGLARHLKGAKTLVLLRTVSGTAQLKALNQPNIQ